MNIKMKIKEIINKFYLNKKEKNKLLRYVKHKQNKYIYKRMIFYKNIINYKLNSTKDYIYIEYFKDYLKYIDKIIKNYK